MAKLGPGMGLKLEPKRVIRQTTVKIVPFSEEPLDRSNMISLCANLNRFLTKHPGRKGFGYYTGLKFSMQPFFSSLFRHIFSGIPTLPPRLCRDTLHSS